jgi:hypothetical protein
MDCPNHHPVPCRTLQFELIEDPAPWMRGHLVLRRDGWGRTNTIGHTDGTGCPACGWFEPYGDDR